MVDNSLVACSAYGNDAGRDILFDDEYSFVMVCDFFYLYCSFCEWFYVFLFFLWRIEWKLYSLPGLGKGTGQAQETEEKRDLGFGRGKWEKFWCIILYECMGNHYGSGSSNITNAARLQFSIFFSKSKFFESNATKSQIFLLYIINISDRKLREIIPKTKDKLIPQPWSIITTFKVTPLLPSLLPASYRQLSRVTLGIWGKKVVGFTPNNKHLSKVAKLWDLFYLIY